MPVKPSLTAADEAALPSATVIVLRDGEGGPEVLLLQRNPELRNMGGAWVFPGGKVDPDDVGDSPAEQSRHAAARELAEEAGVTVSDQHLDDFSHWLTPVVVKRRFATWFYITRMPAGQVVEVDGSEIVAHRWIRPVDAVAAQRQGELSLPPPTMVTLMDISHCEDTAAALALAGARQPPYYFPVICTRDDDLFFLYPGDAGYEDADPSATGPRHRSENRGGRFDYLREIDWLPKQPV